MKRKENIFAVILSLAVLIGGCTTEISDTSSVSQTTPTPETQTVTDTAISSAGVIANEEEAVREEKQEPLRVALGAYSYTYNPFITENEFDAFINDITGVKLLARDRNGRAVLSGIDGERRLYNGNYYNYIGIADISEAYNEESDETAYSIKLRDDVYFSDGEKLDADDVIFTLYVLLDPSFSGKSSLQDIGIRGEVNYRLNSSIADTITAEEITEALADEEVRERIKTQITRPLLEQELEWVKTLYSDSSYSVYTEAYPRAKDLMAYFYSVDSTYNSTLNGESEVLDDLTEMYGGNYELLGSMYRGDAAYFTSEAEACAIGYITEQQDINEPVNNISGIIKTGSYSLDIIVKGSGSKLPQLLSDVTVAPLHYYGSKENYDYTSDKFGFNKGEALSKISERASAPLGAGPYSFEKSESSVVYLCANEHYYKGVPVTEKIEVVQAASGEKVNTVAGGTADISYPERSAKTSEEIENANEALEKLYPCIVSSDGYGYIGMNVKKVNVGGDPYSDESVALRKAIATAISLNREASIREYCGNTGLVADYPSSADVYLSDSVIEKPYSVDIEGEPIYTDSMSENERFDAAKAACLDYFEAAGYTVSDKLVTAAPEDASMIFNVMIAAEGTGNHPSYNALTGAKKLLGEIGITLQITDTADPSQLWVALSSGTNEIWANVWETGIRPKLSEMYSDNNYFGIESDKLSECVSVADSTDDAEQLREAFINCYTLMFDRYAAEIPVYQRSSCIVFSTLRIDVSTLPKDITSYYTWTDEAEKLTLKGN